MSAVNSKGSERIAVAAVVAPGALTAAAKSSGWIDMRLYNRLMGIISTGTLGTSATVDAKWVQADDSSGNNPQDSNIAALAQIVKATGDNKQAVMNFDPSQSDYPTKPFVKLVMTVGVATSDGAAIVLGIDPRHKPVTDFDPASVVQVVGL
jgi:hypothetical protein